MTSRTRLVNTQPVPGPTKLRRIPATDIPTIALRHLRGRVRKRIVAVTLAPVLRPKDAVALAGRRALFDRQLRIKVHLLVQHPIARAVSVASRIRVAWDGRIRWRLARALEDVHAVARTADLGAVPRAFEGAIRGGDRGSRVREDVAAVALAAVFEAKVGVAGTVRRAGLVRQGGGGGRFTCQDAGSRRVGIAAFVRIAC